MTVIKLHHRYQHAITHISSIKTCNYDRVVYLLKLLLSACYKISTFIYYDSNDQALIRLPGTTLQSKISISPVLFSFSTNDCNHFKTECNVILLIIDIV